MEDVLSCCRDILVVLCDINFYSLISELRYARFS